MQTVGKGFLSTQCPVGKENSTYTGMLHPAGVGIKKNYRSASSSGSVSQRYGSVDPHPHPDPFQNVTNPEHCHEDDILLVS
jgi:hypothetical protein